MYQVYKSNDHNVNLLYCNCQNLQNGVHFVLCPEQANKIEGVVLNMVCMLGISCPKQSQGFKPSAANLYPNIG